MNSVDETLSKSVARGYPLALAARTVHEGVSDEGTCQVPASKINATSVSPKSQAADRQRLRFLRDGRANK